MSTELQQQLDDAMGLPYGRARSIALENVVRRAEAEGAEEIAFAARLDLVEAYLHGGEPRKSLVPFARCVTDFDADPAKYGEHQWELLWNFKSVPSTLSDFPEVPLERAYSVLDDMERRWKQGGHSLHAVHQHRWLVADHIGDAETAEEQFRLWSTAPRDDLSDCAGCDPNDKVQHLINTGRTDEAVALGHRVLSEQLDCITQPQKILTSMLPAYVAEGMTVEAVDAHRKAYRLLRGQPGQLESLADHVRFCAMTGNEVRAVELIESHLAELDDPPSTFAEMNFLATASTALRRLADLAGPELAVRRPSAVNPEVAASDLAAEFAERATALAARFDERNGTDHQSRRIAGLLTEQPWTSYLPLSETAQRAHERRIVREPAALSLHEAAKGLDALSAPPEPALASGPELLDQAEEAWFNDDDGLSVSACSAFQAEVPPSMQTPAQTARVLDLRGLHIASSEPEQALAYWREALELHAKAGDELRMTRTRARIGRLLCDIGQYDEGMATGEEPLRRLMADDEPRRRPGWRFSLALMFYSGGRHQEALKEVAQTRTELSGDPTLKVIAALLHGDLLAMHGRLPEAEAATSEAIDALGPEASHDAQRSAAYRQRALIRNAMENPDEAVGDLAEAVALLSDPAHRLVAAMTRLDLADAYLEVDRPLDAAETAEEALTALDDPAVAPLAARAREILTNAYNALGELDSALAQIRVLIDTVEPDEDPNWLADLRQEEGKLLEQLNRDNEAVAPLEQAAAFYAQAERPYDQIVALRRAGRSAMFSEDFAAARAIFGRARQVLDVLPGGDPQTSFHDGGLWYNLAEVAMRCGDSGGAITQMNRAADTYEQAGHEDQSIDARLIVAAWGGSVDETWLRSVHAEAEEGSDAWYRAGWLLVDQLRASNRGPEADRLESTLTQP
ncbi:tetratricopeptide repeat protein [Kribbella deserti]|uniref:Tetratricopeptide repeat protein n=1 Tax=Kribbella deserti TaxID=1926257 RepID=A0ABV6QW32_9ACTN